MIAYAFSTQMDYDMEILVVADSIEEALVAFRDKYPNRTITQIRRLLCGEKVIHAPKKP